MPGKDRRWSIEVFGLNEQPEKPAAHPTYEHKHHKLARPSHVPTLDAKTFEIRDEVAPVYSDRNESSEEQGDLLRVAPVDPTMRGHALDWVRGAKLADAISCAAGFMAAVVGGSRA